jgi:hypothetical protein
MSKNKGKNLSDYPGNWIQIKVPAQLLINIKIEALRENKLLKTKMIELLEEGYQIVHHSWEKQNKIKQV